MTHKKYKLLFVSDNFPPVIGGSAVVYDQLCRYNKDAVVALTSSVTYKNEAKSGAHEYDSSCGFQIYRRKYLRAPKNHTTSSPLWSFLQSLVTEITLMVSVMLQIAKICRWHNVDVVCVGDLVYGGWIAIYTKYILRKKVAIYAHGEEISQEGGWFYARARGYFLQKADVLFVVSLFCKSQIVSLFSIDPEKIKIILNGVNLNAFTPGDKEREMIERYDLAGRKIILAAGRHVERKGFDNLIASFPAVRAAVPDAHLLIVGDGPQTPELSQQVSTLGLDSCVTFLGRVSDYELMKLYRTADVFTMPNRTLPNGDTEGFGLVFLEANACGTPVVGGKGGGAIEAVIDGVTGFTVDGYAIDDISHALTTLLRDDTLRELMGRNGLELAQQSSWESKAAEFVESIDALIRDAKGIYKPGSYNLHYMSSRDATRETSGDLKFLLTVDLEEAFDWGNVSKSKASIEGLAEVMAFHQNCINRGIYPTYFATYGMLTTADMAAFLKQAHDRGECDVGLHPHVWNTPPFVEDMNEFNTFQCNLPPHIESTKVSSLANVYRDIFGKTARSHRAGRYGVDASSYHVLKECGVVIDFSPSSGYDYRHHGGPNFSNISNKPFWTGPGESILCVPVPSEKLIKGPDVFSHLYYRYLSGLLPKGVGKPVRLTPEGNTLARMKIITEQLLKSQTTEIVLSVHSTSLHVGGNPYSVDEDGVRAINQVLFEYTDWLFDNHSIAAAMPDDVLGTYTTPSNQTE